MVGIQFHPQGVRLRQPPLLTLNVCSHRSSATLPPGNYSHASESLGKYMNFLENIWNIVWGVAGLLILFGCLSALFTVIGDLFRDRELSGWGKGGWLLLLVFLPFLGVLVYLMVRGKGMDERLASSPRPRDGHNESVYRYDTRYII